MLVVAHKEHGLALTKLGRRGRGYFKRSALPWRRQSHSRAKPAWLPDTTSFRIGQRRASRNAPSGTGFVSPA